MRGVGFVCVVAVFAWGLLWGPEVASAPAERLSATLGDPAPGTGLKIAEPFGSPPPLRRGFGQAPVSIRPGKRIVTHAILGPVDLRRTGGRAGHLLLRDPQVGSVGLYGSVLRKGIDEGRRLKAGLEAELFLPRATLAMVTGVERERAPSSALGELVQYRPPGGAGSPQVFAAVEARAHVTQDIQFSAGYRHQNRMHLMTFGLSRYVRLSDDLAVIGALHAQAGSGFASVWGRVHLVPGKAGTLIRHERTIGATDWLRHDFYGPAFNQI